MIPDLAISTLRKLYQSGAATPADVLNAIYDRIEAAPLNPVWITLIPRETALAHAVGTSPDLPLYGIPFAIKDNIDAADYPTTAGCPAFAFVPDKDAFVVARLRAAGAILIGKTNLDQFATGLVGTRSPYGACSSVFDSRFISGGSSSGSAVAVASGFVSFSLGTDTAGSGRVPAAFNNIIGLKPSCGLLSTSGVVPACRSLDCVSIFALSCRDASTVLQVASGYDPGDPYSRSYPSVRPWFGGPNLRIGIPPPRQLEFFGNEEYQRLYGQTVQFLKDKGHSLVEIDLQPFRSAAELLYSGPYVAERFASVGNFVKSHQSEVDRIVGSIVMAAEKWTASDAYNALYKLKALEKETNKYWETMDALLLPTTPTTYTIEQLQADPVGLNSNLGYYTNFVNLLDYCGVAVPAGFTKDGMPFGVTVIGRAFFEEPLLRLSHCIQEASTGWVSLGVVGAHLSGQPLNHQLTDRGAVFLRKDKTAGDYRFYALTNTKPAKPGLIREPGFKGPGIEIEIWSIHESQFGSFAAAVPPPLSIGTCVLQDGSEVKGFLCEPYAAAGKPDITDFAGWRAYLLSQTASQKGS